MTMTDSNDSDESFDNFINGAFVPSDGGPRMQTSNPFVIG